MARKQWLAGLRRRGTRLVDCIADRTGYNADQLAAGLQLATGLFLMLALMGWPQAWNALSLHDAAITPVYAVVTFVVVLQANLGTASQFVLMRAAGAVAGGLAGLACMYLTLVANGGSYDNTATKGAVMVTLLSALTFFFSLLRFRLPRFWFAFTVTTFSMPMVALNPYYLNFVQYKALFYWWLQIALGIGTAALVSTFVFPVTAGAKVKAKTAEAMRGLARLTSATVRCMTGLRLGEDGLPVGLTGVLDEHNAADTGLSGEFKPLYDAAIQVSAAITQTRALLLVVDTEWNAYSSAHTFPREAYDILLYINRAYLSSLLAMLYPLQSGRLALRAVQRMAPEFQKAADLLAACLTRAADCIAGTSGYDEALGTLRVLEERWHLLGALCPIINSSWGENEVLTSDMLVGTLFSLGTRVRRLYFTLPEALRRSQPGARAAAFRHFRHSKEVWDLTEPQEVLRQRAFQRAATSRPDPALSPHLPSPRGQSARGQQQQQQQQRLAGGSPVAAFRAWLSPRKHAQPAPQLASPLPRVPSPRNEHGSAAPPVCLHPSPGQTDAQGPPTTVLAGAEAAAGTKAAAGGQAASGLPVAAVTAAANEAARAAAHDIDVGVQPSADGATEPPATASQAPGAANATAACAALAAAAAVACAEERELPTWHQLPSRGGTAQGGEEALWETPDAATLAERFPPTIFIPQEATPGRRSPAGAAHAVHAATGLTSEHAALALQAALAMGAACALHVSRASYEALHEKTIWVVVTVAVVLESSVGGLVLKSGLRIVGTVGAGLIGVGLMGLAYLCNGLSYANEPPKFVAMTAFLPCVGFLLMINHVRFAVPYGYMWSCCKFTTPIIALSGYVTHVAIWQTALYRALNILLGIGLDLATATLVLPVTSRVATKHRVQEVLAGLADLAETTLQEFVADNGAGPCGSQQRQQEQPGSAASAGAPTARSGVCGLGSPRREGASPAGGGGARQRRAVSLPRTPLSTAEAVEIALGAAGGDEEARRALAAERAELAERALRHGRSIDDVAITNSRAASLDTALCLLPEPAELASMVGGSPKWNAFVQMLSPRRQLAGLPLWRHPSLELGPCAASLPDPDAAAAPAAALGPGSAGGSPLQSPWGQLPEAPSPLPPVDVGPPTAALGLQAAASPFAATALNGSGNSDGASGQATLPRAHEGPETGGPGLLLLSPQRVQRHAASHAPDLPTVVSQQVLLADELPSLPPLHIPLHHQLTIAEDVDSAASAAVPRQAQQAQQHAETAACRGGSDSSDGATPLRGAVPVRRPSTSSTVFWLGTPRAAQGRRRRSRWLRERALGRPFMTVRQRGAELATTIAHMHELALFARFEWSPFERPHRTSPADILAAQHACRKLLNVLLTFAYLADSPDVPHRGLLMPVPREVQAVAEQMGEALRALALLLDRKLAVHTALSMVYNLQLQVQLLLLEVEQAGLAAVDVEAAEGRADAVLGVAALGVMFSATQTVQLLYRCVLRLMGTPAEHAAAEEAFAQSAAWGASVEAVLVARGVVLSTLGTDGQEAEARAAAEATDPLRGD